MSSNTLTRVNSNDSQPEKPARFRCSTCQQGFTRTDHLKRHQLRHSGIKPYICTFCKDAFARVDSLRNHYSDCSERGDQPVPETDQKGRRRHACELCISMKSRCEGDNPCRSCQKRGTQCVRPPGLAGTSAPSVTSDAATTTSVEPQTPTRTPDRSADLGSIKFLLNNGTDGFMEDFRFPSRNIHPRIGEISQENAGQLTSVQDMVAFPNDSLQSAMQLSQVYNDPNDPNYFNQNFFSFFDGPFDAFHRQWQEPMRGQGDEDGMLAFGAGPSPASSDGSAMIPTANSFSAALMDSLLIALSQMHLHSEAQQALASDLQFLLTPRRIRHFVSLYFKNWHPNCPIVHPQSFDPEYAELPLLAALVFMGAMYSLDERELTAAKKLLDLLELYIYSLDVFAAQAEMCQSHTGTATPADERTDWSKFQHFQAGYLMIVIQYWAGTERSKHRVMEIRYSEVIKVARKMGLPGCRHRLEDRISQDLWIQRETRIRTMNIIWTLDCAFLFYQNYPCRMTLTELGFDLPCEESLFDSRNPFAEPSFRFSRDMTLRMAFEALLSSGDNAVSDDGSSTHQPMNWLGLSVLDMFILMHVLYYFIHVRMSLLIPLSGLDSSGSTGNAAEGPIMARIQHALICWKDHWIALRKEEPKGKWETPGLFKNSYNFWLVAHLLVSKKDSVDVIAFMEPKCEDKLERLKILV